MMRHDKPADCASACGRRLLRFSRHPELTVQEVSDADAMAENDWSIQRGFQVDGGSSGRSGGVSVQDVANAPATHPFMLSCWHEQVREGRIVANGARLDEQAAVVHSRASDQIVFSGGRTSFT